MVNNSTFVTVKSAHFKFKIVGLFEIHTSELKLKLVQVIIKKIQLDTRQGCNMEVW